MAAVIASQFFIEGRRFSDENSKMQACCNCPLVKKVKIQKNDNLLKIL